MKVKNETLAACFFFPEGTSHSIPSPKALVVLTVDMNMQLSLWDSSSMLQRVNRSGRTNSILEYPRSPRGYRGKIPYSKFSETCFEWQLYKSGWSILEIKNLSYAADLQMNKWVKRDSLRKLKLQQLITFLQSIKYYGTLPDSAHVLEIQCLFPVHSCFLTMHSAQHPCESQPGTGLTELMVTPNLCPQIQTLPYKLCITDWLRHINFMNSYSQYVTSKGWY